MKGSSQTRKRARGQSLIETALMLLVIILVIFWVFELSWVFYVHTTLADAANEGVRYGIVRTVSNVTTSKTAIQTVVQEFAAASLHDVSAMTVTVSYLTPDCSGSATTTPGAPDCIKVDVSYTYLPYLRYFVGTPTMHAYAQGAMVVK